MGYNHNGKEALLERLGAVGTALSQHFELVVPNPPFVIDEAGVRRAWTTWIGPDTTQHPPYEPPYYKWFEHDDIDCKLNGLPVPATYKGVEETMAVLQAAAGDKGFNGILGYSQGGATAALACAMQARGEIDLKLKFAVSLCGFRPYDPALVSKFSPVIDMPSFILNFDQDPCFAPYPGGSLGAHTNLVDAFSEHGREAVLLPGEKHEPPQEPELVARLVQFATKHM